MKKEIGFVAVGQAGGNIGSVLEEKGFNVLYLNTSAEDLSTLEKAKYKYHIEGGEGCHKDRDKAKTLFARDFDKILEEIKTKVPEKIVFVIFSTGGGTGSGIGPVMVDILSDELEKSAGAVAVLPGKNETVKAFMNSYECMKELADVENTAACFFIDNNSCADKFTLNKSFADHFESLISIPEQCKNVKGNLDRAELKEILCTKGAAAVCKIKKDKFEGEQKIINIIRNNGLYAVSADRVIKYVGVSSPNSLNMDAIKKEFGSYLDYFQAYNDEHVLCVLSGLSFPFDRVLQMKKCIEQEKEGILSNMQAVHKNPLKDDINFLAAGNVAAKAAPEKKKRSCRDMLAKYK